MLLNVHLPIRAQLYEVWSHDGTVSRFDEASIDALITIGGDGSLAIGDHLHQNGLRVIGVPNSIVMGSLPEGFRSPKSISPKAT